MFQICLNQKHFQRIRSNTLSWYTSSYSTVTRSAWIKKNIVKLDLSVYKVWSRQWKKCQLQEAFTIGNKFLVTSTFMAHCIDVHKKKRPQHNTQADFRASFHEFYAHMQFMPVDLMRPTVCFHANKDLVIIIVWARR